MPKPLSHADRISTYAASAASALNDDLTIALTVLDRAASGRATDQEIVDARSVMRKASYRNAMVLSYMFRNGARRTPACPEALIETCRAV